MNKSLALYLFFNETLYESSAAEMPSAAEPLAKAAPLTAEIILLSEQPTPSQQEMLQKLLTAIGRTEQQLQVANHSIEFNEVVTTPSIKLVWVASADLLVRKLPHYLQKYHPQMLQTATYLSTDTLTAIEANANGEKKRLWMALQQVFGLA